MRYGTLFLVSLGFVSAALAAPPSDTVAVVAPQGIERMGMDLFEQESLMSESQLDEQQQAALRMSAGLADQQGKRPEPLVPAR